VALRQGPHIKVATVASRWQRMRDLIGSGFEPHTSQDYFWPIFKELVTSRENQKLGHFRLSDQPQIFSQLN